MSKCKTPRCQHDREVRLEGDYLVAYPYCVFCDARQWLTTQASMQEDVTRRAAEKEETR